MTKQEAKREACGLAAALLSSDMDTFDLGGSQHPCDDPERVRAAMNELIAELRRRGKPAAAGARQPRTTE